MRERRNLSSHVSVRPRQKNVGGQWTPPPLPLPPKRNSLASFVDTMLTLLWDRPANPMEIAKFGGSELLNPWTDWQKICTFFPHFNPQNSPKMGVNRRFQAKRAKYSNCCIFKTTNAIATKFFTVIKTIKLSLWVVQKFAPQTQNGGRPPS